MLSPCTVVHDAVLVSSNGRLPFHQSAILLPCKHTDSPQWVLSELDLQVPHLGHAACVLNPCVAHLRAAGGSSPSPHGIFSLGHGREPLPSAGQLIHNLVLAVDRLDALLDRFNVAAAVSMEVAWEVDRVAGDSGLLPAATSVNLV